MSTSQRVQCSCALDPSRSQNSLAWPIQAYWQLNIAVWYGNQSKAFKWGIQSMAEFLVAKLIINYLIEPKRYYVHIYYSLASIKHKLYWWALAVSGSQNKVNRGDLLLIVLCEFFFFFFFFNIMWHYKFRPLPTIGIWSENHKNWSSHLAHIYDWWPPSKTKTNPLFIKKINTMCLIF